MNQWKVVSVRNLISTTQWTAVGEKRIFILSLLLGSNHQSFLQEIHQPTLKFLMSQYLLITWMWRWYWKVRIIVLSLTFYGIGRSWRVRILSAKYTYKALPILQRGSRSKLKTNKFQWQPLSYKMLCVCTVFSAFQGDEKKNETYLFRKIIFKGWNIFWVWRKKVLQTWLSSTLCILLC